MVIKTQSGMRLVMASETFRCMGAVTGIWVINMTYQMVGVEIADGNSLRTGCCTQRRIHRHWFSKVERTAEFWVLEPGVNENLTVLLPVILLH